MKRNILHNATRKAAALLTAAVMVTAGTTTAWAESAYQEAEQSVLDSYVASMAERWGTQMAEMENGSEVGRHHQVSSESFDSNGFFLAEQYCSFYEFGSE